MEETCDEERRVAATAVDRAVARTRVSSLPSPASWPSTSSDAVRELVDALVGAIDTDRYDEIERFRLALEPWGLTPDFDAELRLSGTGSNTWGRCEFCGDAVDELDADGGMAA